MTTATLRIRRATPADIDTVIAFNGAMAEETENKKLDPETLSAGVRQALTDENRCVYFVAEIDGEITGQAMITTEWSDWRNGYFWWIQSVYVDAEYRRQGVYRALDSHVHSEARRRGDVCGIRLYVERNNHVAQQVYSRLDMHRSHYDLFEIDFVL